MPTCHPRELKELRRVSVPAQSFEAGRKRVLIAIAAAPFVPSASGFGLHALVWKPAMTAVVVGALALSGGGAVFASQASLPGERLYAVKLATEGVQEQLTLSPSRKFEVQAAHAARRLEETEKLMARDELSREEQTERVQIALHEYESHLFTMNAIALDLSVTPHSEKDGDRAIQAAERMLDRHAAMIVSATVTQPNLTDAMLEPTDAAMELQADVLGVVSDREEGEDGRGGRDALEGRHKDRSERIHAYLRELQDDLDREKAFEKTP